MKLELSNNEVLELKILHRAERDRKKCDRIKAILMFNTGYSAVEIGAVLLIDENTVSGWKDLYLNRKNTQEWLRTQCIGYQGKLDKDQESQIDTYDEFKKNLKEDEVLLFLDGVHPQHNTKCSRAWIKIGEQKQIKSNSGRRRLNISGAYDPISQDILVREDKTIWFVRTKPLMQKQSWLFSSRLKRLTRAKRLFM